MKTTTREGELGLKEVKRTKITILLFIFLISLFVYKTLPVNRTNDKNGDYGSEPNVENRTSLPNYPISEADLKEEEGKYIDTDLRFTFRYPKEIDIQVCELEKCIYIPRYSIRVEYLKFDYYDSRAVKDLLLGIDLFCKYETEFISVSCNNIKMEEYKNSESSLSYVLYRSKNIREENVETGVLRNATYHEKAYIFPIKDEVYGFAILSTDSPLRENQEALFDIINTFKLI